MSRIAVIGAGVVGAAAGRALLGSSSPHHSVVFVDVDGATLERLRASGLAAIALAELPDLDADVLLVTLPTPTRRGAMDLSAFYTAFPLVAANIAASTSYRLVVIRSTVLPGTTDKVLVPLLERESGRRCGPEFGVCVNPEFLRRRSALQDAENPWVVVIGSADELAEAELLALYAPLITRNGPHVVRTDYATAEMINYASNLFNATQISFANEVWGVCRRLGIEADEVMDAVSHAAEGMWNPRYGIKGGRPFRGSCLPKDLAAFLTFGAHNGYVLEVVEAVAAVNARAFSPRSVRVHPLGYL